MQQGNGGSTIKEVKGILGQPESVSSTAVKVFKVKSYSWTKFDTAILVQFSHKKAIIKTVSGFKWARSSNKLSLKAFNSLKDGSSYSTVVNAYGEPDGLSENVVLGKKMSPQLTSLELKLRVLVQVPVFHLLTIS